MPDADLTEFITYSNPRRRLCPVGEARPNLSDTDRAALDAAVATDQRVITNKAIVHWFAARGVTGLHPQTVLSHRNGSCSCQPNG